MTKKKGKRILCIGCKKPIKIEELGGITKEGMFHDNICCLIQVTKPSK